MEAVSVVTGASSRDLVDAACAGDREAFASLVRPHVEVALGVARLVAGSGEDGRDAVQEALLSAWQDLPKLRDPVAFPAWFRRHVVRAAMRSARRRGRHAVRELDVELVAPDGALEHAVDLRELDRAFDRLSPDDRLVLTLRHAWDLPGSEIAALLGIPEGTVKSRVHAAMARLRAAYDAEGRR
jgi:RNA polymerase sigma-70 factor (ECF subfamily)